jgi:hypothetical protein
MIIFDSSANLGAGDFLYQKRGVYIENLNVGTGARVGGSLAINLPDDPSANIHINNGSVLLTNGSLNGITRPVSAGNVTNEIAGRTTNAGDAGQLRLSAGGGLNPSTKTFIDMYGFQTNSMTFGTNGVERMCISGGNVGIGTLTPSSPLHVVGNTQLTGNLNISGLTYNGSAITSLFYKYTIDLTGGVSGEYYPVVIFPSTNTNIRMFNFMINKTPIGGSLDPNNHALWGYAAGGGWDDAPQRLAEIHQDVWASAERSIYGIFRGAQGFVGIAFYLRGGPYGTYHLIVNSDNVVTSLTPYTTPDISGSTFAIKNLSGVDVVGTTNAVQAIVYTDNPATTPQRAKIFTQEVIVNYNAVDQPGVRITNAYGVGIPSVQAVSPSFGTSTLLLNPAGGNVGVGTTNPTRKLAVAGDISCSTLYYTSLSPTPPGGSLSQVLTVGNNAGGLGMTNVGTSTFSELNASGNSTFSGPSISIGSSSTTTGVTIQTAATAPIRIGAGFTDYIEFRTHGNSSTNTKFEIRPNTLRWEGNGTTSALQVLRVSTPNSNSGYVDCFAGLVDRNNRGSLGWTCKNNNNPNYVSMAPSANEGIEKWSFTAQHQCQYDDILPEDCSGLIVECVGNVVGLYDVPQYGINKDNFSNAAPVVKLCKTRKSKKILGVIKTVTDEPNTTTGDLIIQWTEDGYSKGDKRVQVNCIGEGLVWVVNTGGIIEVGDLITSSSIAGYGEKQDDDLIHSYTLGKSTFNCDFIQEQIPKKKILKDDKGDNILDDQGRMIWVDSDNLINKYEMRDLGDGIKAVLISVVYYSG